MVEKLTRITASDVEFSGIGQVMSGISRIVRDALVREVLNDPSILETAKKIETDPALTALSDVITSIQTGKELVSKFDSITSLIHNQEQRAGLIDNLLLTHDYARLVQFLQARQKLESILLVAAAGGNLNPSEALAFLGFVTTEIKGMSARVQRGSNLSDDVLGLLEKVDAMTQEGDKKLAEKYKNVSPHVREIARRITTRFQKIEKTSCH